MFDLLKVRAEVVDAPNARAVQLHKDKAGCDIEFRNVQFAYDPEKRVLKGISFSVPAGGTIAIVGPSGSGYHSSL